MIKIGDNRNKIMKDINSAWRKHRVFERMDDAVEIVNWMRGRYGNASRKR